MAKKIKVRDLFEDGNSFFILSKCRKAALKAGWDAEKVGKFLEEAKSGDYDNLLRVVMKHFDETEDE